MQFPNDRKRRRRWHCILTSNADEGISEHFFVKRKQEQRQQNSHVLDFSISKFLSKLKRLHLRQRSVIIDFVEFWCEKKRTVTMCIYTNEDLCNLLIIWADRCIVTHGDCKSAMPPLSVVKVLFMTPDHTSKWHLACLPICHLMFVWMSNTNSTVNSLCCYAGLFGAILKWWSVDPGLRSKKFLMLCAQVAVVAIMSMWRVPVAYGIPNEALLQWLLSVERPASCENIFFRI